MEIRRAVAADGDLLLDIWLRSVGATHAFVSDADIAGMTPQVRTYLASSEAQFWVICEERGAIMGFMGMSGGKLESLFLAPEYLRRGAGRRLVAHAQAMH